MSQTDETKPKVAEGLVGVVASTSAVCHIDGQAGQLIYRGYDIHELAGRASFEEVAYLLLWDHLPNAKRLRWFKEAIANNHDLPWAIIDLMKTLPPTTDPMVVLRTVLSMLSVYDPHETAGDIEANERKAIRMLALTPAVIAGFDRVRHSHDPIKPEHDLGYAENFLYMLRGRKPDPVEVQAIDMCLVLHADHGFNASTFTARVIASTLSGMYSAVVGAIGALKGPLHGGASEQVMPMLHEIGSIDKVEPYLKDALAEKRKIMGFGHRVYKTEDPRATHLRKLAEELTERAGITKYFKMARAIEDYMRQAKGLYCNVDFYAAIVYHALAIDLDLNACLFAMSRTAGWCAHVLEQYQHNKLIRPLSEYVGPKGLRWAPADQRP
ncbi:MAG: citrate synthase [Planctomycetes bacterium]|nr:citrate synthase [Planctomycetota bacterium]